jgi:hypothetical protein
VPLDRSSIKTLARLLGDDALDPGTPDGLRALGRRIAELNGPGPSQRPGNSTGRYWERRRASECDYLAWPNPHAA